MWATSSRCGRRQPQAEVGTQTDPPTAPVSPAQAPAAPPTHRLSQMEEEVVRFCVAVLVDEEHALEALPHAQCEPRRALDRLLAENRRREEIERGEQLEARWHQQAGERMEAARRHASLEEQLRRRASGAAGAAEAQTTASTADRSAQLAVQEAQRREELLRRGELVLSEADDHCEYEEYPPCENRRGRSRSRSEARRD